MSSVTSRTFLGLLKLFYVSNRESNLEPWSCTKLTNKWKKELQSVQNAICTPVPVAQLCHAQRSIPVMPTIPDFQNSEEYAILLTGS
jgi:hypothetical protein